MAPESIRAATLVTSVCSAWRSADRTLSVTRSALGGSISSPRRPEQVKLAKAVSEFDSYLRANAERIPNYGERRRAGEAISTAFTESAVNQVISKRMVKKQQMRWTPQGAHLLLQVRTRVLNDQLASDFHRWSPNFTRTREVSNNPQTDPISTYSRCGL